MILLPSTVRIFLCTRSTDKRKSFDGLSGLVAEYFRQELLTGHLFLFLNRRRDRIMILNFASDGLVIWYKRMDRGSMRFRVGIARQLDWTSAELAAVLSGIDLVSDRRRPRFDRAADVPLAKGQRLTR